MEKSMKKRYMYAMACSLLWSAQAMAQTAYDAVRYAGDELNGTARFVGMGGAMGSFGSRYFYYWNKSGWYWLV